MATSFPILERLFAQLPHATKSELRGKPLTKHYTQVRKHRIPISHRAIPVFWRYSESPNMLVSKRHPDSGRLPWFSTPCASADGIPQSCWSCRWSFGFHAALACERLALKNLLFAKGFEIDPIAISVCGICHDILLIDATSSRCDTVGWTYLISNSANQRGMLLWNDSIGRFGMNDWIWWTSKQSSKHSFLRLSGYGLTITNDQIQLSGECLQRCWIRWFETSTNGVRHKWGDLNCLSAKSLCLNWSSFFIIEGLELTQIYLQSREFHQRSIVIEFRALYAA